MIIIVTTTKGDGKGEGGEKLNSLTGSESAMTKAPWHSPTRTILSSFSRCDNDVPQG